MRDQFFPSPISGTEIHPITIRNEICKNRKRIQRSISISSRFRVDETRRAEQTEASDDDAQLARLIRNTRGKERREKNIVASATHRKRDRRADAARVHYACDCKGVKDGELLSAQGRNKTCCVTCRR